MGAKGRYTAAENRTIPCDETKGANKEEASVLESVLLVSFYIYINQRLLIPIIPVYFRKFLKPMGVEMMCKMRCTYVSVDLYFRFNSHYSTITKIPL